MPTITDIKLKSRYIPVGPLLIDNASWIGNDSYFRYPFILINLANFKEHRSKYNIPDDVFLLTDSGGFQVISGKCNYDWKQSLEQQLMIGATRIFAFDTPPLIKAKDGGGSNAMFNPMDYDTTKKIIEQNFDVAMKQSDYLKQHAPDKLKDFFYILHGSTKELLDYNIELIKNRIGGMENYTKYFGGVCYSVKGEDNIFLTTAMIHANQYFIKRNIPVHVLGFGSETRMVIMVRCKITTFDSTTAANAKIFSTIFNHVNMGGRKKNVQSIHHTRWPFTAQFCDCPVCCKVDFIDMAKNAPTKVGQYLTLHNLYQLMRFNTFLDSIEADKYTETVKEFLELDSEILNCLEYIDLADKIGIDKAYEKYKHFMKPEKTMQKSLF